MKKKLITALLAVSMVMSLCACNAEKTNNEGAAATETTAEATTEAATETVVEAPVEVSTKDFDPDQYVTLGDFESVEVTVDVYNYTEEDIEAQMQEDLEYYVEYADLYDYTATDKEVVEEGDLVNINYSGKKDGVAFDGGTADGQHLEIGSGMFIPGFEDGLIGHKVGEDVALDLTFPENYGNAELAGAAVVFDVKINSIDEKKMPEFTDEFIAKLDIGVSTMADFRKDVEQYLVESCEETNKTEKENVIWEAVYELCEVKDAPQELVDSIFNNVMANTELYAGYYGVTVDEFVQNYMGMTTEEYQADCQESALETAKERLVIAAIAKKANITLSDSDLQKQAEQDYEENGYESAQQLLDEVGMGQFYDYTLSEKVYEYLATCVTIKENEPVSIRADEEEMIEEDVEGEDLEEEEMDEDAESEDYIEFEDMEVDEESDEELEEEEAESDTELEETEETEEVEE